MNIHFLIIPIGCGVMGYFTNWLAIKMLFRPHTRKNIFGYKVPFTPGILPSRKEALAKQVSESVGNYLLTDTMIKNSIINNNLNNNLNIVIDNLYKQILNEDKTLGAYINQVFENKGLELYDIGEKYLIELLVKYIGSPKFKDSISIILKDKILDLMENTDIMNYIEENKDNLVNEVINILDMEVNKLVEDKVTLKDVIPESYILEIRKIVFLNIPYLITYLQKLLEENEDLDNSLKEIVKNLVNDNLGRIVGGLFSNKVYENLKQNLINYVNQEENHDIIAEKIYYLIDTLLCKDIELLINIVKNLNVNQEDINFKDYYTNLILENIKINSNYTLLGICKKIDDNFDNSLNSFIHTNISRFIDKELNEFINKYTDKLKTYIFNIKINPLIKNFPSEKIDLFKNFIIKKLYIVIEKGLDYGIKEIDVKSLVENKINDFEASEIETMILHVTNKELKYITLMGGVLGFILGFLLEFIRF